MSLFISTSLAATAVPLNAMADASSLVLAESIELNVSTEGGSASGGKGQMPARQSLSGGGSNVIDVPFYSQFADISSAKWQKLGCGITSLAMIIELYRPGIVAVNKLLKEGINAGAFINGAGWSHKGLALLAENYGLKGANYDLSGSDMKTAFAQLEKILKEGPVIASVHYKLDPKNPIPHLIVVNGINNGQVYYNDPASAMGGKNISIQKFMKAWKKRYITARPETKKLLVKS